MSHLCSRTLHRGASARLRSWYTASECRELSRQTRRRIQTTSPVRASEASSTASSSSNPYPYPTNRHPTPYQLFHLPSNASKADIKARYYELVRLYHPDKQVGTVVDEDIARARFQAITAAYDVLTGKTTSVSGFGMPGESGSSPRETMSHATTAAYRAARRRRQELYDSGSVDDVTQDRLIVAGVVLTIFFVIYHTATTRREVLSEMASRHREYSSPRRRQLDEENRLSQGYSQPPDKA